MKLRLFFVSAALAFAAVVTGLARGETAQSTHRNASSNGAAGANGAPAAAVASCEQLGLVSMSVRGAPNAFCVPRNTCNTNYIGSCPSASAVDVKGELLASGSCCAALESTGEVGCVSVALVQSGAFQCLSYAGAGDAATVVDHIKATVPPTTTAPPPATTEPPQTTSSADGSRGSGPNDGETPPPSTTTPKSSTPATRTPTPSPSVTTARPVVSSNLASPSSFSGSSSGSLEPEAGVDPTITAPPPPPPERVPTTPPPGTETVPTTSPPVATGPLETLQPIPGGPGPVAASGETRGTSNANPNTGPLSAFDHTSTASGSSVAGALSDNLVLVLVLGTVASVAILLGAMLLRRRRASSAKAPPTSAGTRTGKTTGDADMPKRTLDGDDDMLEDLQFRQTDAFSPIFVQPTHSYTESQTPGNDRQSYFL